MNNITYCENCNRDREYTINTEMVAYDIKGTKFTCPQRYAKCAICGENVYVGQLFDENSAVGHDAYRAALGIITVAQIEELLEKYDIGAVPLSRILGWGDSTIYKQMTGSIPSRERSDQLMALFMPDNMKSLIEHRGNMLTTVAKRKVEKALMNLSPRLYNHEKLYIPEYFEDIISQEAHNAGIPAQEYLIYVLGKGIGQSKKQQERDNWNIPYVEVISRMLKQRLTQWNSYEKEIAFENKREWKNAISLITSNSRGE